MAQAQTQVDAVNSRALEEMGALKQLVMDSGFRTRIEELQPWITRNAG